MSLILDGTTGVPVTTVTGTLPVANGGTGGSTPVDGFKNRIINGAMVIDQRNAGASVNVTTELYTLDRWYFANTQTGKLTCQQNAGAVTPPAGFKNYLGITSATSYSVLTGDLFALKQSIEGFNTADLGFGAAGASTVTLSFWVRSSLTGTFGASLVNSAFDRSFVFSYTINAANTWEYKTVTVAGDTSGTWIGATNGIGLRIYFNLGCGSTFVGTANTWSAGGFVAPSGATSVVGTNGATFYITGVQLEKGSTATSFDYRPYGTELALCQRYAWKYGGTVSDQFGAGVGLYADGNEIIFGPVMSPVLMRTTPSMTVFGTPIVKINGSAHTGFTPTISSAAAQMSFIVMTKTSHGLTATVTTSLNFGSTSDYLIFSAEL